MDLVNSLIHSRILLSNLTDGFSVTGSCKNNVLSIRLKILFLLEEKDQTPADLISALCIAKSNLANVLKSLINDGLIESYKNLNNTRNINYHILDKGKKELDCYKRNLQAELECKKEKLGERETLFDELTKNLTQIIQILEKEAR